MTSQLQMTRNVCRWYRRATQEQRAAGLDWYRTAWDICQALADEYGHKPVTLAGVMAALSPNNSWGANVNCTVRAARDGKASGTLGQSCGKADRILDGERPLDVLGGLKVRSFFVSILTMGETDEVCVDRHAYSLAIGQHVKGGLTERQYAETAAAYRRAARILGVPAAKVQAVTWTVYRDSRHASNTDAFSIHELLVR